METIDLMDLDEEAVEDVAPHRAALSGSSLEALAQGGPGLFRLLSNVAVDDVDARHRRLRLSNAALQERVFAPLPASLEVLQAVGYAPVEDCGETWLVLDSTRYRPAAARAEAAWLRSLVERRWRPVPWPCPTCTLSNSAAASNCAACEGPRPPWATPPDLPMPRLEASALAPAPSAPSAPKRTEPPGGVGISAEAQRERGSCVRRELEERRREREQILAEARADRQRFADVTPLGVGNEAAAASTASVARSARAAGAADEASAAAAVASTSSSSRAAPSHAVLRVRLADGTVVEVSFGAGEQLVRVFEHIDAVLRARGESAEDYSLLQSIPRRAFLRGVLGDRTLAALGLAPASTLSVLRGADRGRVESGGVERALLTGDIEGLSYGEILEFQSRMGFIKSAQVPSARALRRQTKLRTYGEDAADAAVGNEERCAICLGAFERGEQLRKLWCEHEFHVACVDRWFADKDDCPICRKASNS